MASHGVKRSLDIDSDSQTPTKKQKTLKVSSASRSFQNAWLSNYDWLKYEPTSKLMFCNLCIKTQKSNSFTSGCSVLKKDNLTKHEKSKDHRDAVHASKLALSMRSAKMTATSKSQEAVISAMRNVYFTAMENLPSSVVPELNKLCIMQGSAQLKDLRIDAHTSYEHNTSVSDFQDCIASVLREDIKSKLDKCDKFSIMIDESTDISVKQNLISYIRILESDKLGTVTPHTYFLGINELYRANAESIFTKLIGMLKEKGIAIHNLCSVSTDGAAVMVGSKSGVVTRLKEYVPGVLATHCIAHRLALSCATDADTIPYLVKYQEILNSIFKFFKFSPKNMATLSAIQSIVNAQEKRFKEVFHTRWLSFEGAVDSLLVNYSSLVSVFMEETSGKALSLYKPVTSFKFLYVSNFMADCLQPLAFLSKAYQSENINFSEINPLLASTIETIEEIRDKKNGEKLQNFLKEVPAEPQMDLDGLYTFQFGGHTIRDSSSQRIESDKICTQFVDNMVRSLNARFTDSEDTAILTSLTNYFNPTLQESDILDDIETIFDYFNTFGFEGTKQELKSFSKFARNYHESGSRSVFDIKSCCNLAIKHKDAFPVCSELAERLLVAPVSTADCERGFSKQNLIKTALRNAINIANLDNLMTISINGPDLINFDFHRAFQIWAEKKNRRILM